MVKRPTRLQLPALGEWYSDLLKLDAKANNRSEPMQAQTLLIEKLKERESEIKERVEYVAKKNGASFDETWMALLKDEIYIDND